MANGLTDWGMPCSAQREESNRKKKKCNRFGVCMADTGFESEGGIVSRNSEAKTNVYITNINYDIII